MPAKRYVKIDEFTGDPWLPCPHCKEENLTPARNAVSLYDEIWLADSKAWCPDCGAVYTLGELADKYHEAKESVSGDNDPLYTK